MPGDGDFCEVPGHGRMWKLKSGHQWCPHSDHGKRDRHNSWKVITTQNGKRYFKIFHGEKPRESGAIDFGKQLQAQGLKVDIVSGRPFRKPRDIKVPPGSLWCCYCLKVREFVYKGLRHKDGTHSPAVYRCPVCHMTIRDAAIRDNNDFVMIVKLDPRARTRQAKVPSEKLMRTTMARR